MKQRTQKIGLALLIALSVGACTSSTKILLTDKMPSRPTNYREIMVYVGPPPIESRPLAIISVARRGENSVWGVEALKSEAAEIGADGVANLDITYSTGILPELRISGLAVKHATINK